MLLYKKDKSQFVIVSYNIANAVLHFCLWKIFQAEASPPPVQNNIDLSFSLLPFSIHFPINCCTFLIATPVAYKCMHCFELKLFDEIFF